MVAQQPARRWIALRIRVLCIAIFAAGSLFPPYIPPDALAGSQDEQEAAAADEGPHGHHQNVQAHQEV
jgi:hypothetical protein